MPKKPSFLDRVLAHSDRRPRQSDGWPAQLKAEIDEALKLKLAGDTRPGLKLQSLARLVAEALTEAGIATANIHIVKRYLDGRLTELRRG